MGKEANSLATDSSCAARCRCCHSGALAGRGGEQQRPGGALAEPAGEQRRVADLGGHPARRRPGRGRRGRPRAARRWCRAAAARCRRRSASSGDVRPALAQPGGEHQRPRRVDLGPNGECTTSQSPSSSRKRSTSSVRSSEGGRWPLLLDQVGLQVGRAPLVEPGCPRTLQPGLGRCGRPRGGTRPARGPARGPPCVAVPERHLPGCRVPG